jgi:hypothetical protein
MERGEIIYLCRPDSVLAGQGNYKVRLQWLPGGNAEVKQTVIYWNNREDSLVHNITRAETKEAVVIEALEERVFVFELVNVTAEGERSLPVETSCSVLGDIYRSSLFPVSFTYVYNATAHSLTITWAKTDEKCQYSTVSYKAYSSGAVKEAKWTPSDGNTFVISDFNGAAGNSFTAVTYYRPNEDAFEDFSSQPQTYTFK